MAEYICIDGGTTNTRITLVNGNRVIDTERCNIGSGKNENNAMLKKP